MNPNRCQILPILCSDCSELPGDCKGGSETMKERRKNTKETEDEYLARIDEEETWDRLTEGGYGG